MLATLSASYKDSAPYARLRQTAQPVLSSAKALGMALYGDESRTRASLMFGFGCVALYAVALSRALLCSLG
ncbi:MAG: hypothetical protein FJX23_07770 [Alphaproteobacteria bacterium]|nr:hypothetical protein [Alphaproteobacteria bacterium]